MAVTSTWRPVTSLRARVAQPFLKRRPPPNGTGSRSKDHLEGMVVALQQSMAPAVLRIPYAACKPAGECSPLLRSPVTAITRPTPPSAGCSSCLPACLNWSGRSGLPRPKQLHNLCLTVTGAQLGIDPCCQSANVLKKRKIICTLGGMVALQLTRGLVDRITSGCHNCLEIFCVRTELITSPRKVFISF
ncbi:hypothetical protein GQ55_1G418100 [Panicum hallii var. hallii]|uniref:Uncharacterized protein n=1 Tax=Panicum hallii var. hallii TaxID=1504633 RepID=A0A2T7FD45_9POAL|nr:hypothetical protein GQ55_1G418100 [Panicum hallii var. hallii]